MLIFICSLKMMIIISGSHEIPLHSDANSCSSRVEFSATPPQESKRFKNTPLFIIWCYLQEVCLKKVWEVYSWLCHIICFVVLVVKCRNWTKITAGWRGHVKWRRRWVLVCGRLILVSTVCWRKLQSIRRNMNLRWLHSEVCFWKQVIHDLTWKHSWKMGFCRWNLKHFLMMPGVGWAEGQNELQNKYFNEKYDFMYSRKRNYLVKHKEIQ